MITMKRRWTSRAVWAVALCCLVGAAQAAGAGEGGRKQRAKQPPDKGKLIESKAEKAARATAVDFGEALGLGVENLATLGARIDQARAASDPVALMSLAKELAAAEKVAKKQAAITGEQLFKQAVEMAKRRNRPNELRVVAVMAADEKTREDLERQAEKVAAEIKSRAEGEKPRGIMGTLHVDNRTEFYIIIFVDNRRVGVVGPYGDLYVYIGQGAFESTYLYGDAAGTPYDWGPIVVRDPVRDYTWRLWH